MVKRQPDLAPAGPPLKAPGPGTNLGGAAVEG
jgi:hypothetical protein